ncbi:putative CPD photolyase [Betaentomopoxvirus amoorei]|uniref:Deoxyribodipyrimidine photo-lyase n=1 Tax=Amsacta moorei entomopoxvirus TaxID=28321 RepID=Q9EN23_AMEPV|nr:putative CPD photolyase [Amsacta moorei entomopoxvirus]AAG02731.1 AMV025 [Amsacta moorei entomopoxvirus]
MYNNEYFTNRVKIHKKIDTINKNVLYLAYRDLRVYDNWSFLYSQNIAYLNNSSMYVLYLINKNNNINIRQYKFLYEGLPEFESQCKKCNVSFHLLSYNNNIISNFINKYKIGHVIIEQMPLLFHKKYYLDPLKKLNVNVYIVDSHNIIPVWVTSDKQEYNARTIRIKINKLKDQYLIEFPKVKISNIQPIFVENNFDIIPNYDKKLINIYEIVGGYTNGINRMNNFFKNKINTYKDKKNNPNYENTSILSPWLHCGMISAQRCVLEANKLKKIKDYNIESIDSFIEEIFIRKELSDNFCYYNNNYKSFASCPNWAILTLEIHKTDKRNKIFSLRELEYGKTDNKLWNYCQYYLLKFGYLNGYMRMFWAKKLIEWTNSPQDAIDKTIYLNDKYFFDGYDPMGYVNILWSIGGLHDRAFKEREMYGKIRFMSQPLMYKKLNVNDFYNNFDNVIKS